MIHSIEVNIYILGDHFSNPKITMWCNSYTGTLYITELTFATIVIHVALFYMLKWLSNMQAM